MLKQINTCPQWFIDATFQIAPKGFQQVLNIVVYVPHLKIYFPGCYIFMTNKTESLYNKCFEMLKAIAKDLGFELKPKFLMCDFELALRNAAKSSFPDLEIGGCYFHFVKCLYDKITKLRLRRKVFRPKSRLLVSFLQILVHCEQSKREELYEEIKKIYSDEDKAFEDFLNYFHDNWLKNSFMDTLFESLNQSPELEFIRTNNPCESFHYFMGKVFLYFIKVLSSVYWNKKTKVKHNYSEN